MPTQDQQTTLPQWERNPLKHLVLLAWPIAISMVSQSVMSVVDTFFVSKIGTSEIAGVGLASTLSFALVCFGFGLLRAVKVVVSQARGADRHEDAPAYLGAGIVTAIVLGLLLIAASRLVGLFINDLSATAAAGQAAHTYFLVRMFSSPAMLLYVAFREYRYGCGDSKLAMIAALAGNGLNILLDYLFIVVGNWGVEGAAWASVIGCFLEALIMVVADWRVLPQAKTTTLRHLRAIWEIGLPSGVQFTLEMGSFTLLTAMISRLSDVEMAAHQVALQVIHFAFLPAVAFGEAASVMVGEAIGGNHDRLVKPVSWVATKVVTTYMALCGLLVLVLGPEIAGLFGEDSALLQRVVALFRVASVFLLFDGTNIVCRCVLRGVGDVRFPAAVGIVVAWMFTPPLMWLLGYQLGWGALGGWLGLCGEVVLGTIILAHRLSQNGWYPSAKRSRERVAIPQVPITVRKAA